MTTFLCYRASILESVGVEPPPKRMRSTTALLSLLRSSCRLSVISAEDVRVWQREWTVDVWTLESTRVSERIFILERAVGRVGIFWGYLLKVKVHKALSTAADRKALSAGDDRLSTTRGLHFLSSAGSEV